VKNNPVVHHPLIVRAFAQLSGLLHRRLVMLCICAVVLILHGCFQWSQLQKGSNAPWSGSARVIEDPVAKFGGTQVVLNIEGKRYLALAHAMAGRRMLSSEAGNVVHVEGVRAPLSSASTMRYASRHIVGTFTVEHVSERVAPASPLFRSANKTRAPMLRAAQRMPRDDAALFMGLVIGDDRAQPRTMIRSFRQSGLSHLTAVSGQNVAFVLTVFGVYINRARTWWRLGLTLFLLGWFVVVTRAEPSVLRATMMAAMSALAFARGRDLPARKALLYSVVVLLAIDPLLVFSIGMWMSSLATCGLVFISPWLKKFMHGPKWIREPLATTLGAQLGVMPISLLIFSSAPAIALVTNLLAVPVAGFVMLAGLPIAFICGLLITLIGPAVYPLCMVAMLPIQCAVRWVWWVAVVGERMSPHGVANALLWVVWGCFLVALHRSARMHT
jgi:competence protein ComEC